MRTQEEVGKSIKGIVDAMNSISIDELNGILGSIGKDEALGPMLNPTFWQGGGMFEASRQTRKVIQAIHNFKVEVSGIGNFKAV